MTFKPRHLIAAVAVGPADDAQLAERVVDAAMDIAQGAGTHARVTLLYVHSRMPLTVGSDTGFVPPSYYAAMDQLSEQSRAFAAQSLARLQERAQKRGAAAGVSVDFDIIDSIEATGETIATAAQRAGGDAIVLCSHGRRGLKRVFLGSVASRVTNASALPVVILRPHD